MRQLLHCTSLATKGNARQARCTALIIGLAAGPTPTLMDSRSGTYPTGLSQVPNPGPD